MAGTTRRAVVLVDGEHQPDAVRAALARLVEEDVEPVALVYVGGTEKVDDPGRAPDLGYPTHWPGEPLVALPELLRDERPDVVIDRTADPVVTDRRRGRFVAVALSHGIAYEAAGVRYEPPERRRGADHPTVEVIATGKRTGKTAVSGALARYADANGHTPVVVAMGRGGPAAPVVVEASRKLTVEDLIEVAAGGGHAASDFYEDAVMTGVATIGCRRVGEGPSGAVGYSNVPEGLHAVNDLDVDLIIAEGSGAAMPPLHADATVLVVPADADPLDLHAMLPLRFLLADLVFVTMADPRLQDADAVGAVVGEVHRLTRSLPGRGDRPGPQVGVVITRFRAQPLEDISGLRTFVATTAPEHVGPAIRADLEERHGADVVGITHALSDRSELRPALASAPEFDVLLTELKAAGIDVAARVASERGARTVFYDNRPEPVAIGVHGDVPLVDDLGRAFARVIALARHRHDADRQGTP